MTSQSKNRMMLFKQYSMIHRDTKNIMESISKSLETT